MTEPKKTCFYRLQYNVITYSPYGVPVQVCFHGPDTAGFASVETARKIIQKLEEGDVLCNKSHVYDIVPVLVAEDYGQGPEVTFAMDNDEDLMEDLPDEGEEPPASN